MIEAIQNSRWKFSALEGKWAAKKVRLNTGNSLRESWTSSTAIIGYFIANYDAEFISKPEFLLPYPNFQAHNESKNIFKAANTPITLGAVAMLLYVLCQLFSLVGLLALANIINLV